MNNRILTKSIVWTIVFLCIDVVVVSCVCNHVQSEEIERGWVFVDDDAPPEWYDETHVHTIQEGINNASVNDTVYVYNGLYQENVLVDKTLQLIGEDRNNTIVDGGGVYWVITVRSADWTKVSGFTVRNSGPTGEYRAGIQIGDYEQPGPTYSCHVTVAGNNVYDNDVGIVCWPSSDDNIIQDNNVHHNNYFGIACTQQSYGHQIIGNNVGYNGEGGFDHSGINLGVSGYSIIKGNDVHNNIGHGILLYVSSDGNEIFNNYIYDNVGAGIRIIIDSNNNNVYHNNFINNTPNAHDECGNTWYNETLQEGNYWDDFDEPGEGAWDNDSNGIVDTPYAIPGGDNQDLYPFIDPYGWLNNPPEQPIQPAGRRLGFTLQPYTYTTSTTDPEGYPVYYNFSWDDGTSSGWLGPYPSGDNISTSYAWSTAGHYHMRVKAKDTRGYESTWSEPLPVRILGVTVNHVYRFSLPPNDL